MHPTVEALAGAVEGWSERGWPRPHTLLVSGSGLGIDLGVRPTARTALADLLPFEVRRVVGHEHTVELLPVADGHVLYQRGRLHAYQGYDAHEVVFVVRLAALLGARRLVMTNAAGGIRQEWRPGALCAIRDQINLSGMNPLAAELPREWGPEFQDMTDAYSPRLRALAATHATTLGIELHEGVYASVLGPSFETPAEVEMLRRAGADLVGMSTVLEVVAARHLGLECLVISLVSNAAAGTTDEPVRHDEVLDVGRRASEQLGPLIAGLLQSLPSRSSDIG